ncbi:hypothetical protein OG361_38860 [Streptomyces sp. NBC_00090]|uniref:hypothetical protein n=1 Tax=Streptomyces sp. NBC_00090 TaxID=2903619 RepID=UPI0032438079
MLTTLALAAAVTAVRLWPREDPAELEHVHAELAPDHPHLADAGGRSHRHDFHIDALHRQWPAQAPVREKSAA